MLLRKIQGNFFRICITVSLKNLAQKIFTLKTFIKKNQIKNLKYKKKNVQKKIFLSILKIFV